MKKVLPLLLAICFLFTFPAQAQDTLDIPNHSFENWETGQGYSVSLFIVSLPVYNSFQHPTDWDYLSYPVNETVSYSGFNLNVNTNVPLLKTSSVTGTVPDGDKALKLESFMLSDIVSSLAYSLLGGFVDQELLTMTFPTVLSTGHIDLDNFMPLMSTILDNINTPSQLLQALSTEDLDHYITGGLALNGFEPSTLSGYYKYASAISGDNGGILMLGTRYNDTTHRREVVGGGFSLAFTDTNEFTPFSIEYQSLHEYDASYPDVPADSLILMLVSSANNNRQQGSAFTIDDLTLTSVGETPPTPPEPDTCGSIVGLTVNYVDSMQADISWNNLEIPESWQYLLDTAGFTPDEANAIAHTDSALALTGLQPDTYYDFYVRSKCNDTLFSNWAFISFKTDTLVPVIPDDPDTNDIPDSTGIHSFFINSVVLYPNPTTGILYVTAAEPVETISVYDIYGRKLLEATDDNVDLTTFSAGVYVLEINHIAKRKVYKK